MFAGGFTTPLSVYNHQIHSENIECIDSTITQEGDMWFLISDAE